MDQDDAGVSADVEAGFEAADETDDDENQKHDQCEAGQRQRAAAHPPE
jgi:hypothetical protein